VRISYHGGEDNASGVARRHAYDERLCRMADRANVA